MAIVQECLTYLHTSLGYSKVHTSVHDARVCRQDQWQTREYLN